jgi:hypothetical protein
MEETGFLHAHIDKRRLHTGQNPRDFAFVNIPGDTHFFFPFNQKFGEETVFNDRDTVFLGRRIIESKDV